MSDHAARVRLLGGFTISGDHAVLGDDPLCASPDAAALIQALGLAQGLGLSERHAAELLWPADEDAEARLRRAIEAAQDALGPAAVALERGGVVLRAEVDVAAFESAAAIARAGGGAEDYERALRCYGGPLLPGNDAPWAAERRAQLASLHTTLCVELAELHGVGAGAHAALARALEADPLAQPAHRALMLLFARSGRRQRAIAQYHLLRRGLRAEEDAEPDRQTIELYQALLPAVPASPAAPPPPAAPTSFVGRSRELSELAARLRSARLVTLTGPGGAGKSRLAREMAGALADLAPDGMWIVDLANADDEAQVAEAAAVAVGLALPAHRPAQEALAAHLAARGVLLVLDGCERQLGACGRLAHALLEAGPAVRVLATSREPLRCAGEADWPVPPLAEAPELFVERARAARAAFRATDKDRPLIAAICERLQGLPLAVEIAAARTATLSLHRIADDLRARLGDGGAPPADVMREVIDWSYELLRGEERVLLRRLSVFAGGATGDAVREVCAGGAIERRQVGELLGRLIDRGLAAANGERVALLDPVRAFAAERLAAAGVADMLKLRHLDWAVGIAADHDPTAGGRSSPRALEPELDNLRGALAFALERDPKSARRLAGHLRWFWAARGRLGEARRCLDACLAATPATSAAGVDLLLARAALALRTGEGPECLRHARPAVRAYALAGDERAVASALCRHALLEQAAGGDGEASFARAHELAERCRDRRLLASIVHASALVPWSRGDAGGARLRVLAALDLLSRIAHDERCFFDGVTLGLGILRSAPPGPRLVWEERVLLFDRFNLETAVAYALNNVAWAARHEHDLIGARAAIDEALGRFRGRWDRAGEALTLTHLGRLAAFGGDVDEGRLHLIKALALRQRIGDRRGVVTTTVALGRIAMADDDVDDGRRLLAEALARAEAVDDLPAMAGVQSEWAIAEEALEELPRAARLYEDAAALWQAQGLQRYEGWTRLALGDVLAARGDEGGAATARIDAATLLRACRDEAGLAVVRLRDEHAAAAGERRV